MMMKRILVAVALTLLTVGAHVGVANAATVPLGTIVDNDVKSFSTGVLPAAVSDTDILLKYSFKLTQATTSILVGAFGNLGTGEIAVGSLLFKSSPLQSITPSGFLSSSIATFANLAAGDYTLWIVGSYKGAFNAVNGFVQATPIPGALLMFVTALGGLGLFGYRRRRSQDA